MYSQTTHLIKVTVIPEFENEMSSSDNRVYVWSYTINIENFSNETVQLLTRHWRIIDANGHVEVVKGKGVVGQQPVIHSKEAFEYASQTYLTTPSGIMMGSYQMLSEESKEIYEIIIPAFSLDIPNTKIIVN